MRTNNLERAVALLMAMPVLMTAQPARYRDPAMLKSWAAPLYWQPTEGERTPSAMPQVAAANSPVGGNAMVFVAMTPCRIADTRASQGFPGAFGAPSLVGGATGRTFPIQSNTACPVPSNAQAYSLNLTIVAPAPYGFITAYPTPGPMPLAATLNWATPLIVGNAAIVPAGTNGSVDIFASAATDLVIDINGYYAAPGDLNSNIAIGVGSLASDTTGSQNMAIGPQTLANNTTGIANTASGYHAMQANTTGRFNTATGVSALEMNTSGEYNTAVGDVALASNTTGNYNTASGASALVFTTVGSYNAAHGDSALLLNTTGNNNTSSGYAALHSNTTGNNNIAIGYQAAYNVAAGNGGNIHIGTQGAAGDAGVIRIGGTAAMGDNAAQTSFFVAGVSGVRTGNANAVSVVIDSNGQLGTVNSSRRFKEDIHDMGEASSGLLRLRPVTFRYRQPLADGSKPVEYGLIAEEVAEVYPDLVAHSADGQIQSVKYQVLDSMLLNELRKQVEKVQSLEARLAELERLLSGKAAQATPAGDEGAGQVPGPAAQGGQ
jgi:hypothetical protein